ncbi:hypothetical protein NMG95_02560 [Metamycoplasma hyosynoviae]|uniref:hypothetical protein n=1 Tax=Metamycoplasma hyosynoviae TaxID=29559 RepID=UPI0020C9155B|nr:hypothetical protein [Metamycoplasma hyosynoviae]UTO27103.1 hypothetical protein NMG95_02560 [Metamycoplasma hyosynoviae]
MITKENYEPIKHINCNETNYVATSLFCSDYKLVVYKDFNTTFWDKKSPLCPYTKIEADLWGVRRVNYANDRDILWERIRLHNEWIAASIAFSIKIHKDKNYLIIYESSEPSFFWDFLQNHANLNTNRKVFTLREGTEEKDFCVVSNLKRFPNFNKVWNSIEDFENAVLKLIEKE